MLRTASDYDNPRDRSDKEWGPHLTDWSDTEDGKESVASMCEWMLLHQDEQMGRALEKFLRNIAWLVGDQYLRYNRTVRAMMHPDRDMSPAHRIKLIFNILYPTIESRLSRLVRDRVWWDFEPATTDEYDIAVTRMQRNVAAHYHQILKMPKKVRKAIIWGCCCGLVGFKTFYDHRAGSQVQLSDSLSPQLMSELKLINPAAGSANFSMMTGQPDIQVVPAIDALFYPLSVTDVDDATTTLQRMEMEAIEVADRYEMTVKEVLEFGREGLIDSPRERAGVYGEGKSARSCDESIVQVCELWRKPYSAFPRGRLGIVLGQAKTLKVIDNPYSPDADCFTWVYEKWAPNSLHGTCTISEMICAQSETNRDISDMAEYRRVVVRGKWCRFHNDQMEPTLDDSVAQTIKVRSRDFVPERLDPPQLGPHTQEVRNEINRLADYIGGVSDATKGRIPAGARAAKTVQLLQAADDDRLSIFASAMDEAQSDCGRRLINICQRFIPDERIARMIGETNAAELLTWNRHKLRSTLYGVSGIENDVDCRVKSFSRLAMSKPAQREMLKELAEAMSKIPDPAMRQKLMVAWDMGDELQILEDDRRHRSRQMREINKLRSGIPVNPPSVADNDIVHVEVIDKWLDSDSYDEAISRFPWIEDAIKQHREDHLQNAENKRAADEYRILIARQSMFYKYQIMTRGAFQAPLQQGGVDGSDSANRPDERGAGKGAKGGGAKQQPKPGQPGAGTPPQNPQGNAPPANPGSQAQPEMLSMQR